MARINPSSPNRRVVIFTLQGAFSLDVLGAFEIFRGAARLLAARELPQPIDLGDAALLEHADRGLAYDVQLVAADVGPFETFSGTPLYASHALSEVRGDVDTLVVAGGDIQRMLKELRARPELKPALRRLARRARRVVSVCTGAFVLAECGLLEDKRATTHWAACDLLQAQYAKVRVERGPIFTQDGNVYTSAGATTGMDLALALVRDDHGAAIAREIARWLVLYIERSASQSQLSMSLRAQAADKKPLRELQPWIAEHLRSDLSVTVLAARVGMSVRNFARSFKREMSMTPAAYVQGVRVEAARRTLELGTASLAEVASQVGFGSVDTLRRAFVRETGQPPSECRAMLSAAARAITALLLLMAASCAGPSSEVPASSDTPDAPAEYAVWPDALEGLPRGAAQTASVCARSADDPVHELFCSGAAPNVTSLAQLQAELEVGTSFITELSNISKGLMTGIAITGHSTGLSVRSVSAINPRSIAFQVDVLKSEMLALSFTRGEQIVELIARDRLAKTLRFYLLGFRQACNDSVQGCVPGDLLTPAIERDWTDVWLYDETALANSVLDCATCHQPAGPGTKKSFLMQELTHPWTHWFWQNSDGGRALLEDYFAAKGDEPLAGMTAEQVDAVDPNLLTAMITLEQPSQMASFDSARIEGEVTASAAAAGGMQPFEGDSPTWRAAYDRAKRGETIAVPYYGVKVTDPLKLERMSAAYRAFRRGELPAADLPDLRDVFPDDPARRAALGVTTEPGLDGRSVLVQACSQCHQPRLDQTISRARFRADLEGLSRAEKDAAIARLELPEGSPLAMPPSRLRVLSDEAKARAIEVLQQ